MHCCGEEGSPNRSSQKRNRTMIEKYDLDHDRISSNKYFK